MKRTLIAAALAAFSIAAFSQATPTDAALRAAQVMTGGLWSVKMESDVNDVVMRDKVMSGGSAKEAVSLAKRDQLDKARSDLKEQSKILMEAAKTDAQRKAALDWRVEWETALSLSGAALKSPDTERAVTRANTALKTAFE